MRLLDEIINQAMESSHSISDVLRKCLVLSYNINNDKLKEWAQSELDGYKNKKELPPYRRINVVSKGHFLGPFNASISDQPLSLHILKKNIGRW